MSNGPQFFETQMGRRYYEGTMPKLVRAIERVAAALEGAPPPPDIKPTLRMVPTTEATATITELRGLLHEHASAWDDEEESVKAEHAALIARTHDLLAKGEKR